MQEASVIAQRSIESASKDKSDTDRSHMPSIELSSTYSES